MNTALSLFLQIIIGLVVFGVVMFVIFLFLFASMSDFETGILDANRQVFQGLPTISFCAKVCYLTR